MMKGVCVCACLSEFVLLHNREITRLKTLLELEREKREELEREADELRQKLHQVSIGLIPRHLSTEVRHNITSLVTWMYSCTD